VAARFKAWNVFARSNTAIVVSNPTWDMHACLPLFSVCAVLCVQVAALRRADPPSKEFYRLCKKIKLKSGQGPTKDCRAIEGYTDGSCEGDYCFEPCLDGLNQSYYWCAVLPVWTSQYEPKFCFEPKKVRREGNLVTCLNNLRGRNIIKFWDHWYGAYFGKRDLTLCFSVSFSFRLPQQTSGKIHKMYRRLRKSSGWTGYLRRE
jgi:hypothetical protein